MPLLQLQQRLAAVNLQMLQGPEAGVGDRPRDQGDQM